MTHCYLRAMSPIHLKCKVPYLLFSLSYILRHGKYGRARIHVTRE